MNIKTFNNITRKFFILLFILMGFFSCDNNQSKIPVVSVDIWIDLSDPLYYDLQQIGGYAYIKGGVNGILVYRSEFNEFSAYERTCPYDPESEEQIMVDENSLYLAVHSVCGSEFSLLLDGAVTLGPSQFPLKRYYCEYFEFSESLHIRN